jgi:hypothetical protein
MANLLLVDVAQEAHFSNKDTWDSCQDGKQIKDVSKQSAKPRNSGVFFFRACRAWQSLSWHSPTLHNSSLPTT